MPAGDQSNLEAGSVREPEVTLTTMNELRIVNAEGVQPRTRVEGVDAHQMEALKAEWVHVTTEITARQNALSTRIGRIEGRLKKHSA